MVNFTSNTYQLKREILTFSNKISRHLSKPDKKFTADMTYGMLASGSCLLTDITDQLHEDSKKVNSVERLTRHLNKGVPKKALQSYLSTIRKWVPNEPVIHIDDSDIVKPDGYKFEALGLVRDGSKSTTKKSVYEKGYHVTEACVLTKKIILSVFFRKYILPKKRTLRPLIPSPFLQWSAVLPCSGKQPLSWTGDTMITGCF